MQFRMSPGGKILKSRRSLPVERPSSVIVTITDGFLTYDFRPRKRLARPVPPPIMTNFLLDNLFGIHKISARLNHFTLILIIVRL